MENNLSMQIFTTVKRTKKTNSRRRETVIKNNELSNRRRLIEAENRRKLLKFAQNKPHSVIESQKKPLPPELVEYFLNQPISLFSDVLVKDAISDSAFLQCTYLPSKIIFDDGVYQEFHKYYRENLSRKEGLNLENEFNMFLRSYLINPAPKPRGRKPLPTTEPILELARKNKNLEQILDIRANEIYARDKALLLSKDYSENLAESMAKANARAWKTENRSLIREKLRYYGFGKRNLKIAEKLN